MDTGLVVATGAKMGACWVVVFFLGCTLGGSFQFPCFSGDLTSLAVVGGGGVEEADDVPYGVNCWVVVAGKLA